MNQLRLDQSYSLEGEWWYPDLPDRRFYGALKYQRGTLRLHARDSLIATAPPLGGTAQTVPVLHGEIGSRPITLCNSLAFVTDVRLVESGHSAASQVFESQVAVYGAHVAESDFCVRCAQVSFENLEEWAQEPTFTYRHFHSGPVAFGVDMLRPVDREFDVPTIGAKLRLLGMFATERMNDWRRAGISVERSLELEPATEQTFSWFNQKFWVIRLLLSTLLGQPTYARAVEGEAADIDGVFQSVSVLLWDPKTIEPQRMQASDVRFSLPVVCTDSPDFVDKWFASLGEAKIAVELFVGALSSTAAYPHQVFSALIHALEAFHRHTKDGTYLPESEYEPIAAAIIGAIPKVESSHRQALKSRIKYGNEYSLRKRLNELAVDVPAELHPLVSPDLTEFVSRAVDTRNYFTHWKTDPNAKPFSESELREAIYRLSRFLAILFLQVIDLKASTIRLGLSR